MKFYQNWTVAFEMYEVPGNVDGRSDGLHNEPECLLLLSQKKKKKVKYEKYSYRVIYNFLTRPQHVT